mmetsp:Transcript_40141/g.46045  ORF Transcript_40141/g.46045 Transcript_40141/m.46045 type:complete len:143 (-) Transcript_40141:35-463(-)
MGNICGASLNDLDQLININFDYKIDNTDPTNIGGNNVAPGGGGGKPGKKRDGDKKGYEDDDRYDHEDNFYGVSAAYMADPELDLGFPEDKREYDSIPCLEGFVEEYNAAPKARVYNSSVPVGLRNIARGAEAFFKPETYGFS